MKKLNVLALLAAVMAVGLLSAPARASVAVSSVNVAGINVTPANTKCPACGTVLKGARLCNDTAVATCVFIKDSGSAVLYGSLCAAAQACSDLPHDAGNNNQNSGGGFQNFAGEVLTSTSSFAVSGSTAAASGTGGLSFSAWYVQPNK